MRRFQSCAVRDLGSSYSDGELCAFRVCLYKEICAKFLKSPSWYKIKLRILSSLSSAWFILLELFRYLSRLGVPASSRADVLYCKIHLGIFLQSSNRQSRFLLYLLHKTYLKENCGDLFKVLFNAFTWNN
jgi:hypothetical protein